MRFKRQIPIIFALSFLFLGCTSTKMQSGIPTNVDQAVSYFEQNWTDEEKESFRSMEEDEAVVTSHFSTGLWIRNNWLNKEEGEDLVKYFQKQGIENKDDMSGAILRAFHKKLNSETIN